MSVTPVAGLNSIVSTGGTAVVAVGAAPNGGIITNPLTAIDQGISIAEPLYVNPVSTATLLGNGTTFRIEPGGLWTIIAGQTTQTTVNAASNGHKFSVTSW